MPAYRFTINGTEREANAAEQTPLLDVLRDTLGLTGTKYGCGEGQCGACTVLVEGKPVKACITAASSVAGKSIETVEGLATRDQLHPLQEAFLTHTAFQCGYCTPGMLMGAKALLAENPNPSPADVRQALEGHVCRCGTYPRIVQAIQSAAKSLQADADSRKGDTHA
jgi:aerobic-type carbon monoxide dehydrogenase small subunit (CoxS/CutS family)